VKYAFIEANAHAFGVTPLCRALRVSRSGYYEWQIRPESLHAQEDRRLLAAIEQVHETNRQAYGAKKTWLALKQSGIACGKHRVARLRQQAGIEAQRKRRFRVVVEHHETTPAAPNLLQRVFVAHAINRSWVGDMTFIRTREGWLHLAVLLDLFSRKVVGWAMGDKADLNTAIGALEMALLQRRPARGLIHHTDQGPLYATARYRAMLGAHGMRASMSRKGNAYDNAVAESFFSNLKNELVHHCDFGNRAQARSAIFEYIELFYNRQRIHQTLGYVSPEEFEKMDGVS